MRNLNRTWARFLPAFVRKRIEGRQHLQDVIGNTGWLFADRVVKMGGTLLVGIWLTRYLGPERFGILSYAIAFVLVFSSIASMGLDWVVVRNIVRDPARRDEILGTTFTLKLAGGVASFCLAMATIIILRPSDHLSWLLVGIIALGSVFQAFSTIDFWFQSQVKSRYTVYARSSAFLLISGAKIALILLKSPLTAFAWAVTAEIVICSAGLVAVYRINGHRMKRWRATRSMAGELLRDSWPLMLTDIVMLAYIRIDQVMLGEMGGNSEVGIYSVAVMLAEAWYFIPMVITSSIFPSVVEAREKGEEQFHDRLQRYFNLMAFLGYAVAVPVTFISGWVVTFLFGDAYGAAGPMLTGLVWAGLFMNLSIARSSYLTVMNWTRLHFVTDLLGLAANVALNLYLIPRYGGMGAVIASLVAYWLVAHGSCFMFKPLFRTGVMFTRALAYPRFW